MGRQDKRNKIKSLKKKIGTKNTNYIVSAANKKIINEEVQKIVENTNKILAEVFQEVMRNNRISVERTDKMIKEIFVLTNERVKNLM